MSAPLLPLHHFTGWLASGERGLSSDAIVAHLTGHIVGRHSYGRTSYPHDPDDFRRCQLLLNAVPLARLAFPTMRTASPEWSRLVDAWDEIHAAIEAEVPGYLHNSRGSTPLGYALMKRAIRDGVKCEACDGSGRANPCERCNGTARRSGGRCRAAGCRRGFISCPSCRGEGYTARQRVAS